MTEKSLPPGSRIGILGGGQLGRMLALAAAELGFRCHIYCPEKESPAAEIAAQFTCAAYEDGSALAAFAGSVDVVTYEFENVPARTAEILATHAPVRPGVKALATAQDRYDEKKFLQDCGIGTAPFASVDNLRELKDALENLGSSAILKTRRFGYDGKGQVKIPFAKDAENAYAAIGKASAILEGLVPFEREISVIVARGLNGDIAAYDPVENIHRYHILHQTLAPAALSTSVATEAQAIAQKIVTELDYIGVMGVEMFLMAEGDKPRILVNEIAPRVHNSGHWTTDACLVDQFELHIRAICGWPLGSLTRHSDAVMTNLIGDDVNDWMKLATEPDLAVHLYGKTEARPGRKMGHATRLYPLGKRPA